MKYIKINKRKTKEIRMFVKENKLNKDRENRKGKKDMERKKPKTTREMLLAR